jgi:hypothetical protein
LTFLQEYTLDINDLSLIIDVLEMKYEQWKFVSSFY